jgi:hypothetical protein
MKKIFRENNVLNVLITLLLAGVFYRASNELYEIAWGTGSWLGEFSRTWAILYYLFLALCVSLLCITVLFIWDQKLFAPFIEHVVIVRRLMGNFRWLLWLLVLFMPVWFLQYTSWGIVFQKLYFRLFIWIMMVFLLTLLASSHDKLAGWNDFLASLIVTASVFSIAASLKYVTAYPFSFGWSEGNRLWDYSVMFGRDLYIYPAGKNIPVFLDFGRNFVGGLPFLFSGVTITMARFWVGLTLIIPYLLLGIALFRAAYKDKVLWLLLVLWTFLFLKQGPIHAPLVLSAALVALAWRAPLRYAIPLLLGAGYLTNSRFTWVFAPGIWIVMLEFSSAAFAQRMDRQAVSAIWKRAIIVGVLGIFGGLVFPTFAQLTVSSLTSPAVASYPVMTQESQVPAATDQPPSVATPVPDYNSEFSNLSYFEFVVKLIQDQPLLWYRLLPNSTYNNGILLSLLFAITPLLIILIYLSSKKIWQLSGLQKLSLILPLLAFLVVGLVASTKIGGGGDLHNMDMFLIGLLFTSALAWQNGGSDWLQNSKIIPAIMKIVVVTLLVNSSITALLEMRSYGFGEDLFRLKILSDASKDSNLGMLPTQLEVDDALETIQVEVDRAKLQGDVLFMDQRQLLTFGNITGVPLVPEYEKKLLMNQALSGNAAYFDGFYADLAARRFSLIISEPLRTPIKDSSFQFGEENNAWVKWVAAPVLCYYEPLETIKTVNVQLLVPNINAEDCSSVLP